MAKKNFITMIMTTVGGILFALGMCMCLLPEWNAFTQGVVVCAIGATVLLVMLIVRCKMSGKSAIKLNAKAIGIAVYSAFGAIVLGIGMCMVMVWNMMITGIVVGVVGIILLLCIIPMCKGLK